MATHDYVIDDQSAPSFRADLNNALMAIVSQNSNATAPTTTFANMLWYDTATNILKKRNVANTAWVNLGTIDETAGTFMPSGGAAIASQAEAEAGTDNTKMMTPLRSAQAIAALTPTPAGSYTLLGTINTTSGTSQTLSGLTLTNYHAMVLEFSNINVSSSLTNFNLRLGSTTGTIISENWIGNTSTGWFGLMTINLDTGVFSSMLAVSGTATPSSDQGAVFAGDCNVTTASTSITIALSNNSFSAGSIRVYGVK